MIDQPQRNLGNADGPLVQFDAVELGHIDAAEGSDVGHPLHAAVAAGVHPTEDLGLDAAEFAVGDDQKVAAAARRVEQS